MRILSIQVKNFRMHEKLEATFDRERTLVAGPNESGKSTLADAIERVLCYPHRSTIDNNSITPRAGGGTPEVTLQFEHDGHTYTIHKTFKGASSLAKLTDDSGNQYAGDDAEERLRAVLGFGGASLRNPSWGWTHLWARQGRAGDDPIDKSALGAASKDLDARLKSMTGTALTESERDTATYDRIAAEYEATFTQNGVRIGSILGIANKELGAAREAATQAAGVLAEYETAVDTVVREEALIAENRRTIADAENELAVLRETIQQIEALEQALATQRTELDEAIDSQEKLKQGDADIKAVANDIDARAKTLAPREQEIARLKVHERRLQSTVDECLDAIKKSSDSQRTVAAEEELLKSIARVFELEAARTSLSDVLEQIKVHQAAIAAIDARLRELPEVEKDTVEALESLDRQLAIGRGKLEASSTRIEVLVADSAVAVNRQPLSAGEWKILTNAAELTIGGGTRLRVTPGGDASLIDLRAEIVRLDQELATKLDTLGLRDAAEGRMTLEQRLKEEANRNRLQERIDDLDGDDVRGKLDDGKGEVEKLEAEIRRKQPDGFMRPTDAAAVATALGGLSVRRNEADAAVQSAHTAFESVRQQLEQTRQDCGRLETELTSERQELRDLEVKKAALETVHGTDREAQLRQVADDQDKKQDAVTQTDRRLKAFDPVTVRDDRDRLERTVKVNTEQLNQAGIRKATAEGQLGNARSVDLHGVKASADARLDIAQRRHAEVNQRAQAVRRLRDILENRRQAVAEIVAAPLRTKVAEYLEQLYGPGSRIAVTKAGETFEELSVTRQSAGNWRFQFDELSGGTKEQVAAACRLAMAEVLAEGSGVAEQDASKCLPMVFDDAFVNSDPDRIKAVHRVLDLGARRGLQIIVFSCTPKDYDFFGANARIDLEPPKSREASFPNSAAVASPATDRDAVDSENDAADSTESVAAPGKVPSGDDASLAADFVTALAARPERKSGNIMLRRDLLGWDEATYERIKEQLIQRGRIQPGGGRGGSVQLLDDN
jgi:DNA repair exonuclease SbcCD ATPase subunit